MPRRLIALVLLCCSAGATAQVVDDFGRRISLASPARRIVSLAPHLTETLYAAHAGGRLVGVAEFSDFPPEARALPRVGNDAAIDLEAVLALRPDLVVAWPNAATRRPIDRLEALGIPVYRSEPRTLEDIARTLERLGVLAGTATGAREAAQRFRSRAAALAAAHAHVPKVRAFYQVWDRPLLTVNGEHLISRVMSLCGGDNVFASLPLFVPEVDREAVVRANPDVILVSAPGGMGAAWLDSWRAYPGIAATARGQLVAVPAELIQRHTPRILEGAAHICRAFEAVRRARS
jgi:iron complex transport system substrate-binding protein